jgi:hypothetical protein
MPAVYLLFAALVFVSFWLGAKLSGWSSLAEEYPGPVPLTDRGWQGCFAVIQRSWFWRNSVHLKVASDQRGFYVKLWPWSLPFYPPLFFPWPDVSASRGGSRWHPVQLGFRQLPGITIRLSMAAARNIAAGAGEAWPEGQTLFGKPS